MTRHPVLVAACFSVLYPEPEVEGTGVTETQPYMRSGGLDGFSCCPVLKLLTVNGDQVHMVLSSGSHGPESGYLWDSLPKEKNMGVRNMKGSFHCIILQTLEQCYF